MSPKIATTEIKTKQTQTIKQIINLQEHLLQIVSEAKMKNCTRLGWVKEALKGWNQRNTTALSCTGLNISYSVGPSC